MGTRPWLAGLLALAYPGLGHVYLGAWVRAIAWFGLALATAALVMPESAVTAFESGGIDGLLEETRSLPFDAMLALFAVRVLNVVDAFLHARRLRGSAATGGERCPHCGHELEEENLGFCPWCTTRFETGETSEAG